MKRIIIFLLALLPVLGLYARVDKQTVVFNCDIHCQGCCNKIMKNIAYERGVTDIVCDIPTKTVTVTYDANKTDVQKILAAFERIGKPATVKSSSVPQQTPPVDANTDATTSATQQSE